MSNKYAKMFGRLGGRSKSKAKAAAARLNGKKGGRPKKKTGKQLRAEIQEYFHQNVL